MCRNNRLSRDAAGSTLIEYALVCFLIAMTCLLAVTAVGDNTSILYSKVCRAISAAVSGAERCQ